MLNFEPSTFCSLTFAEPGRAYRGVAGRNNEFWGVVTSGVLVGM